MQKKHIITITGKPGSGKSSTAKELARRLGYEHHSSGDFLRAIGRERGMDILEISVAAVSDPTIDKLVDQATIDIGKEKDYQVLDGRTGWYFIPESFKVYLDLELSVAAARIIRNLETRGDNNEDISHNPEEYARILQDRLVAEAERYRKYYSMNPFDTNNYDLVVDTEANDFETTVRLILDQYNAWLQQG